MSYFSDASLVFIPSAQKSGKAYSVKPTDGTGDLTFTRSNDTATRVNSAGLIEKVRTNLLTYSEDFTNAAWFKTAVTVTADATTAPDGTTTADKIIATATSGNHFATRLSTTLTGEYTFSVFAKASEYSVLKLQDVNSGVFNSTFDLSAGTASGTGAAIQSVGSGWYRCSVTYTSSGSSVANALVGAPSTSINYTGDGTSGIFVWGAQLETGVLTNYIPTTTAAVSVGPVANVPRLDYLGSSCPRLILEGQRTNLVFNSEQFDNASWSKSAVITANTAVSPDGYMNADSAMESGANDYHIVGDPVTTTSGTAYTFSFFAKPNGRNFARVLFGNGSFPDNQSAYFNLLTGATSATASVTASMVNYGNGWYRCIATCTSDANATEPVYFGPARNMTDGYATYSGNTSLGIYAWGAQQEAGSYATSYIPTLGAAVTRGADFPVNLPTAISLNGDFSLFWEGTALDTDSMLYGSGNSTWYANILGAAGRIVLDTNTGRKVQVTSPSLVVGTKAKILIRRQSGAHNIFVNGVKLTNQVSVNDTTTLSLSSMFWGVSSTFYKGQIVNQSLIFQTALSDADAIALTA